MYFTWETAMVFVGVLLLLNLHLPEVMLIAGGIWFLKDHISLITPENRVRNFYWPL